jgi:hypothetical protein
MQVLSDALSEKDELFQTMRHYEELLNEELIVPSHLYNAVKIKELREKFHYYKAEYNGYVNGPRTLCG